MVNKMPVLCGPAVFAGTASEDTVSISSRHLARLNVANHLFCHPAARRTQSTWPSAVRLSRGKPPGISRWGWWWSGLNDGVLNG